VHIEGPDGAIVAELHGGLDGATNNVAEYNGLLAGLGAGLQRLHAKQAERPLKHSS
jgi:ribonuclease HI